MDVSLSELQELVMNRKAWHAAIHGVAKNGTRLETSLSFLRRAALLDPRMEGITLFQVTYLVVVTVLSRRTVC